MTKVVENEAEKIAEDHAHAIAKPMDIYVSSQLRIYQLADTFIGAMRELETDAERDTVMRIVRLWESERQ